MKIRLALLATLIFSIASPTLSFAAGDRFAVVIGNAEYPDADVPLKDMKPGQYTCQVNVIDDRAGAFSFPRTGVLVR